MPISNAAVTGALPGIDVSHYQNPVDWAAVAQSGIRYCFIKATEGAATLDKQFASHWAGAGAAGLIRGAYHFLRPKLPAAEQADFFLSTASQIQSGDLPPVLDLEVPDDWANIPVADRTPLALTWLQAVEEQLGVTPIVYLNRSFVTGVLKDAAALARYPIWLAHYTPAQTPTIPNPWKVWTFWQYSQSGKTPGIAGAVDQDRFNGTIEDLRALTIQPQPETDETTGGPDKAASASATPESRD
jgi:lysozyme